MTPALERLAETGGQGEAKTRAKKLSAETQQASEQFRAVEARARQATQRLREVRPVRLRELEQAEIRRKREEARAALEALGHEVEEARRELRTAMDHYQQLRRELDRLQPQLAVTFAAEDRLLWGAETLFPGGQLQ